MNNNNALTIMKYEIITIIKQYTNYGSHATIAVNILCTDNTYIFVMVYLKSSAPRLKPWFILIA